MTFLRFLHKLFFTDSILWCHIKLVVYNTFFEDFLYYKSCQFSCVIKVVWKQQPQNGLEFDTQYQQ